MLWAAICSDRPLTGSSVQAEDGHSARSAATAVSTVRGTFVLSNDGHGLILAIRVHGPVRETIHMFYLLVGLYRLVGGLG